MPKQKVYQPSVETCSICESDDATWEIGLRETDEDGDLLDTFLLCFDCDTNDTPGVDSP